MLRRLMLFAISTAAASSLHLSLAFAQPVTPGQHVMLGGTNEQGVPLHREPRPSLVGRIANGTETMVMETDQDGRWLRVTTAANQMGWIVRRYVASVLPASSLLLAIPAAPGAIEQDEWSVWESAASCESVVCSGRRLAAAFGDVLRVATWNIRGFPDGDLNPTPGSRTDLPWLACTLAWMNIDVAPLQESRTIPEAMRAWEAVTDGLSGLTGDDWKVGFQECGSPARQHTGFLWNASWVKLVDPQDLWKLNGAAKTPNEPCAAGLRLGHYRLMTARNGGADFHIVPVHLDSGTSPRDRGNRDTAIGRIAGALAPMLPNDADAIVLGDFNTMSDGTPEQAAAEIKAFKGSRHESDQIVRFVRT